MLKRLEDRLSTGKSKSLVGNKGYARFLKIERGCVRIDEQALACVLLASRVAADARFDGKFILYHQPETSC